MSNLIGPGDLTFHYLSLEPASSGSWGPAVSTLRIERPSEIVNGVDLERYNGGDFSYLARDEIESVIQTKLTRHDFGNDVYCQYEVSYTGVIRGIYINDYPSSNHMPREYNFDLESTVKSNLSFLLRANQVNLINIVGYRLSNTTLRFTNCQDQWKSGNSVPGVQFFDYKFGETLLDQLNFSISANLLASCPTSCSQCTYAGVCVKCSSGTNLVYGSCVSLCPVPFSIPDYKQVCNSILESSAALLGPPQIINEEEVILDYYDDFGFTNQRVIVLHTTNEVNLGAAPYVWPGSSAPLLAESVVIFLPSSSLGFHSVTIPFRSIANSSSLSSSSSQTIDYPWNDHLTPLVADKVFAVIYPLDFNENYLVGTYWNQNDDPESLTTAQKKSPSSSFSLKNRRYQYLVPTGFYIFQAFVECIEECQVEVSCDGQVQLYKNEQISLFNVDFKSSRWTYSYTQNLTGSVHLKFIVKDAKFFQPFISGNNFSLYSPENPTSIFPIGPFPVDQASSCYIPNCSICQDSFCLSCQHGFFLSINKTECLNQCPQSDFYSTAESTCDAFCAASQLLNEMDNECIPACEEPGYYYMADVGCQVCVEDCEVCYNATTCLKCKIDSPLNTETFCFRKTGTLFDLKDFNVDQTVSIKRDSSDMDLALVITDQGSFGNFSFFFDNEGRGIPRILKVLKMNVNDTYSSATIPPLKISEPGYLTTHYLKIQKDDSGQSFSSTGFLGVYYKDFPLSEAVPQIDSTIGSLLYDYAVNDDQGLSYPDFYYKTVITSRIYEHNETSEVTCSLRITFYGDLRGVYINGELVFAHSTSNYAFVTKTTRPFKLNANEMFLVSFIGHRIQLQQVNFTGCVVSDSGLAVVPEFTSYLLTGPSTNPDDFFVLNNTLCGDNCVACLDESYCVQCENTFYLQNGVCVPNCPPSQMQLIYGFCGAKERSQGYLSYESYSSSDGSLSVYFYMPLGMDLQLLVRVHPFVVGSTSIGTYIGAQGNSPSLAQGAYQLTSFVKDQKDFGVNINVESIVSGVTGPVDMIISTVKNDLILFSAGGNYTYMPMGSDFSLVEDQVYYWDFFMNCLSSTSCQLRVQGQGNVEITLNERTFVFNGYLDDFIGATTLNRNFSTGLQHIVVKAYNASKFSFELIGNYALYSQGDLVNHNTVSSVQYQLFNASNCYNGYKSKCYSCIDGYFFDPTTGYCTINCPAGTLAFLPERICITNSSSGLVKRDTYYIFNCTENPGYYYTVDEGCVGQCDQTCLICSGPLGSQCLACPYPRLLQSDNTCICPVGTQDDPVSGGCESLSYVNLTGNPSEIYCDNLALQADIRADELQAYNITFYWGLSSQGTSASLTSQGQIQAYLDSQFSQNVEIEGVYLENNQAYNFTVQYINAANKTIQDWRVYNILYTTVPNITLFGESIGIKNDIDHQFYAEFLENTTCSNLINNPSLILDSTWSVISDDGSVVYSSSGPLEMTLPSCALIPQSSYILNLRMSLKNTLSFTEQNLTIETSSEVFQAIILTNSQNYPVNADLLLEGTIAYSSSCSIRAPGQILYTWFCSNQTQSCDDTNGLFGVPMTSQQLTIPKDTFKQGDNLIFTLEIEKNGNAQNSSSIQISINDPTALFLQIACEDTSCSHYATNKDYLIYGTVQTASGLNLSSSELAKLNVTWTVSPQVPNAYFLSTLKFFSNSLNLTTVDFLTVTFTVQNSSRTFTRSLNLPINHPPAFGYLHASPSSGASLATQFIITTNSWYDPDTPLTYQFYYSFPSDTVLTPLRPSYTSDPQIATILPGQYSSGVVNIWVSVKDDFDAESIASAQVQVSPQIQTLQQAISSYNQLLLTAQSQDDPFEITQIIAMITKEITEWEDILTEDAPNPVCPSCSGHGSCPAKKARCDCEAGWAIIDCFVRESDVDLISNLKQNLLKEMSASYQEMLSNNSASEEQTTTVREMIHQILMESVDDQHFNTNKTLILVQNILNDTLKDYSTTVFSSDEIQAVSEILSDMMEFSSTYDCTGSTSFTKNLEEKAEEYLEVIAESSLSDQIANQNATVITTENLEMYFQKLSICSLDNKVVTTSSTSPQATISVNAGVDVQDCSSQVNLEYYAFNDNLLNCSAEVNENRTLTILGIDITNASPGAKLNSSSLSVTIDFGGNPAKNCPASCKLVSEKVCYCEDLSPFDVGNQLVKVFRNSNLSYLKHVDSILTFQFWKTGSFWMVFVLTAWLFVTLGLIKYKLLTYNVMNKIRQCNKINKRNIICPVLKVIISTVKRLINVNFR